MFYTCITTKSKVSDLTEIKCRAIGIIDQNRYTIAAAVPSKQDVVSALTYHLSELVGRLRPR